MFRFVASSRLGVPTNRNPEVTVPALTRWISVLLCSTVLASAVTLAITGPDEAAASTSARVRCSPTTRPCDVPPDLAAAVTELADEIAGRLGRPLPFAPTFAIDTGRGPDRAYAEATPVDAAGAPIERPTGPSAGCLITFYEQSFDRSERDNTLAHELFHCFQFAFDARDLPRWFQEGSAEWVGSNLAGATRGTRQNWDAWLGNPQKPLFDRDYDAIGFFGMLQQRGVDPWRIFDAMQIYAYSQWNQGIYDVAKAALNHEPALEVAKALARTPSIGDDWEPTGPGVTSTTVTDRVRLGPDDGELEERIRIGGKYGTGSLALRVRGDVLSMRGAEGKSASVGFEGRPVLTGLGIGGDWCLDPAGCECPSDSPPRPPLMTGARGTIGIGVAQLDDEATTVKITARAQTLDDWCAAPILAIDETLCELLAPHEVATALGTPAAGEGVEFKRANRTTAYCFYPSNRDANQVLSVSGFRLRDATAAFERYRRNANGIAVTDLPIGEDSVLIEHGATGSELYILVGGGTGILALSADSITTPPNPNPNDWVDAPLAAALVTLGRIAVSRI